MSGLTSLSQFIKEIGFDEVGEIDEKEVTKLIEKYERLGRTVLFRLRGKEIPCISAIFSTRRNVWKALNANGDEEAYSKIVNYDREPLKYEDFKFKKRLESLEELPWIKFYEKDGGKYITSSIIVACLKNVCNASFHRMMFIDTKRAAVRLVPRHLFFLYRKAIEEGEELKVAIVISPPPVIEIVSSFSPPLGHFEFEIASYIDRDLKFSRTPLYKLPVPSTFSIVIEGRLTGERVKEGPFVDLLNTYDKVREEPLLEVDKIYLGDQPFHIILPGGIEHKYLMGYPREASIWDAVRKVVPKVKKVRLTPGGGMWLHAVISIRKNHEGDGKSAIMAAFAGHTSLKHVVIVDEDVDPDNYEDVEWAIATRFQADKDLVIIKDARGSTLDPSANDGLTTKVGIDATAPLRGRERFRKVKGSVG